VPDDIPENILSQLGFRVQHALRAFTARDRKKIKLVAENFPPSEYYDIDELLTTLGIGEALVTVLNEKGIPTPLAATLMSAPRSRMGILTDAELNEIIDRSEIIEEYNEEIDRRSAYELLNEKIEAAATPEPVEKKSTGKSTTAKDESLVEQLSKNTMVRQLGNTLMREISRGLMGALGVKPQRKRRSTSLW
jgi:hypothetical protein